MSATVPLRSTLARSILRVEAARLRGSPISVQHLAALQRLAGAEASIAPIGRAADGGTVRVAGLAELLRGTEIGTWALGPRSIEAVVRLVLSLRPTMIVEFGSGISTIALAWAMRATHGQGGRPRVLSVEQDQVWARHTRQLLTERALQSECEVLVAPLRDQVVGNQRVVCYGLGREFRAALRNRPIDFLLIDGPAGEAGIRYATLPLVQPFLAHDTTYVLDDALRSGEISIALRWADLGVRHEGVYLVEKGLLVGLAQPQHGRPSGTERQDPQ